MKKQGKKTYSRQYSQKCCTMKQKQVSNIVGM